MAIKFVVKKNIFGQAADELPLAEYLFDESIFTIGSDAANSLSLESIAAEQAVIVREAEFLTLINRAEGTALNGENLLREAFQPLAHGDRIEIGKYEILIIDDEQTPPANPFAETSAPTFEISVNGAAAAQSNGEAANEKNVSGSRNFAEILDALRTEEDSFYFVVESDANAETRRVPLELPETPLGVNRRAEIVSDAAEISTLYAVARKDWSGILLESQKRGAVTVNDETISAARRLRNNDRVKFSAAKFSLVLHEPSSLVALESILSARDPSDARFGIHKTIGGTAIVENQNAARRKTAGESLFERTYFGYFSFLEVVTMIIVTLAGAVVVFLILEFMFS